MVNNWDLSVLNKQISTLNTFRFYANFQNTQKLISILNIEPKILSVPKKLSILNTNFELADGLGMSGGGLLSFNMYNKTITGLSIMNNVFTLITKKILPVWS